ncbi:MAG: transcription termination factor Rho [Clostridia bacterium]|nr:transcription termination factor Rho [Clostridia bacterium]
MTDMNLNELTVIELRKVAKELKVSLGAGISKQGIIDKLTMAIAEQQAAPVAADVTEPAPASLAQEADDDEEAQPQFKQAYVAPQQFNNRPAYQAPSYSRTSAPRTPAPMESTRTQTTRPVGFQSRFGPGAAAPAAPAQPPQEQEEDRSRQPAWSQPRPSFGPARTAAPEQPRYQQRPAYDHPRQDFAHPQYEQPRQEFSHPQNDQPRQGYEQRPAYPPRQNYNAEPAPFTVTPTASDIMQAAECPEITGILELLPEGYGFLRSESMITTSRDVYVAAAQIRRFGLRSGDKLTGKVRPQRDGDKYPALLVVSQVNGAASEAAASRPNFDELTPIYPTRRISLERKEGPQLSDLRLMDLMTPIGFGQRGLIQCGPGTGKTRLLTRLANIITLNHPEAEVMLLLFNETPENVTVIRESVRCRVIASTFDTPPEGHLRLADLIIERAERLAEQKKDVVLLVDSLTTLIRVISTATMQTGRAIPGMISPQSLQKAKRLFGAARCLREGGSLTVIATMNTDSGTKADDSVVNEFRGAANMELVLDSALARAGVQPPFELSRCGTKRADAILTPAHQEGLKLLRGLLSRMPAEAALRELTSMLEKAPTNEELLSRIKVWVESMKG